MPLNGRAMDFSIAWLPASKAGPARPQLSESAAGADAYAQHNHRHRDDEEQGSRVARPFAVRPFPSLK